VVLLSLFPDKVDEAAQNYRPISSPATSSTSARHSTSSTMHYSAYAEADVRDCRPQPHSSGQAGARECSASSVLMHRRGCEHARRQGRSPGCCGAGDSEGSGCCLAYSPVWHGQRIGSVPTLVWMKSSQERDGERTDNRNGARRFIHQRPLFLGGSHAITVPLLKAFAENQQSAGALIFDAQPGLQPGNTLSHETISHPA